MSALRACALAQCSDPVPAGLQEVTVIEIRPLTPTIGAEVRGLDLGEPLDDGAFAELEQAFLDHKVLFFRDQDITTDQHLAVCRHFGELELHPFVPPKPGYPEVMVLVHDDKHPRHGERVAQRRHLASGTVPRFHAARGRGAGHRW